MHKSGKPLGRHPQGVGTERDCAQVRKATGPPPTGFGAERDCAELSKATGPPPTGFGAERDCAQVRKATGPPPTGGWGREGLCRSQKSHWAATHRGLRQRGTVHKSGKPQASFVVRK